MHLGRKQNAEPLFFFLDLNNKAGVPMIYYDTDVKGTLSRWHVSELF